MLAGPGGAIAFATPAYPPFLVEPPYAGLGDPRDPARAGRRARPRARSTRARRRRPRARAREPAQPDRPRAAARRAGADRRDVRRARGLGARGRDPRAARARGRAAHAVARGLRRRPRARGRADVGIQGVQRRRVEGGAAGDRVRARARRGGAAAAARRSAPACSAWSPPRRRSPTATPGSTRCSPSSTPTARCSASGWPPSCPASPGRRRRPRTSRGSTAAALGLGDDPAAAFLERGRVALSRGLDYGRVGRRLRPAQLRHEPGARRRDRPPDGRRRRLTGAPATLPGPMPDTPALILALVALAGSLVTAVARPPWAPEAVVAAVGAAVLVAVGAIDGGGRRRRARGPRADGRVPRRAAGARRGLPARRAVRRDRRAARASAPAASRGGCSRSSSLVAVGGHRGAEPRRHGRPAHPGGLRDRRAAARLAAAARLRVRAPGQLRLAAAAGLQPHEPARVPRERPLVRALRRADAAADARGDRGRVGRVHALLRHRPAPPAPAARHPDARRCRGFPLLVVGLTLPGSRSAARSASSRSGSRWPARPRSASRRSRAGRAGRAALVRAAEPGFLVFVLGLGVIVAAASEHGLESAVEALVPGGEALPAAAADRADRRRPGQPRQQPAGDADPRARSPRRSARARCSRC